MKRWERVSFAPPVCFCSPSPGPPACRARTPFLCSTTSRTTVTALPPSITPVSWCRDRRGTFALTLTLNLLYPFENNPNDPDTGRDPESGVTLGTDGNFYGSDILCRTGNNRQVFQMTPGATRTILCAFTGGSDGFQPLAVPIQGTDGNLYGTATQGGAANCGTVQRLVLSAQPPATASPPPPSAL